MNLVPNEVVGYRLYPDQYNWTIVVVKKYGADSKKPGVEYEQALCYPSTPQSAVARIVDYVTKIEARRLQDEKFDKEGIIADFKCIEIATEKAQAAALWAINDLEERMKQSGFKFSDLNKSKMIKTDIEEAPKEENTD